MEQEHHHEMHPTVHHSFEHKFAKFISYLFHPLLMPTYGFLLIFFSKNYISSFTPSNVKLLVLGITFIFTFILPVLNAVILLRMGKINSLEMHSSRERIIPYASTSLYYLALFYLFYNAEFPPIFNIVVLGAAICIFTTLIINFKWKISAHAVGIGGFAGVALGMIYRLQFHIDMFVVLIFLIAGLVCYARLRLNAHSPAQVYAGFALGFAMELLLMLFY